GIYVSCAALVSQGAVVADLLKSRNVAPGNRVALWLTEGQDHVAAMLGCWMAGVSFCVLPTYAGRTGTERSLERVENVLSVLQPRLVIQRPNSRLPDSVTKIIESVDLLASDAVLVDTNASRSLIARRGSQDLAFVQFTSGSTGGDARGAEVRFGQLEANLDALALRTGISAEDRMVSWAPLYHDMGLMAVFLSIRSGADLVLMETDHFARRPGAWLEAITTHKGTVTTTPPTALKLLSRRRATDVDLRSLRYAWIGGEAVFPGVLRAFEEAYGPAGLAKGVLQPTYGMAETVVGISCGERGVPWSETDGVVSCGRPLDGLDVQIIDHAGASVADGGEGNVMVRGTSVISGYLGQPRLEAGDWFDTGDLGVLRNGHLFVTGRRKDVLKRGAESYPASLVEAVAEVALGLRTGRVAAFTNFRADAGKEEIVLLVESPNWTDQSTRQVASAVLKELGLQIDVIRTPDGGRLPRTSSGKLMRQLTAAQYREGRI
ncbi:MAG: AMP-binding protein, partial [Paracoccaceae bacterium]